MLGRRLMSIAMAALMGLAPAQAADVRVLVKFRAPTATTGLDRAALVTRWTTSTAASARTCETWLEQRTGRASFRARLLWIAQAVALDVPATLVAELARRPEVEAVEPNEAVRMEFPRPLSLRIPDDTDAWTWGLAKLRVPEVRSSFGLTGRGVRVGLIDSGVDAAHPDLVDKIVAFHDLVGGFTTPYDDNGHGTHCAGTIAGGTAESSAGGRAIGVAPDARLLVVKAFTAQGGTTKEMLLAAMQWMADPDGDPATADQPAVCSNSWHGSGGRKFYLEATRRWVALRILPVFATGNDGPATSTTWIPAGYLESFAVGATDSRDRISDFSSHGPITWDGAPHVKPDVCAPGEEVTSAAPGGGYVAMSGTSMATPHVAGALALMFQARPDLSLDRARSLLEGTAVGLGEPGKDNTFGAGRLDLMVALVTLTSEPLTSTFAPGK